MPPPAPQGVTPALPRLGVVIVTYRSADVILDCLESLLGSRGVALSIVVADNASDDDTVALVRDWAAGRQGYGVPNDCPFDFAPAPRARPLPLDGSAAPDLPHRLHLVETGVNGGFAAGVNAGLRVLTDDAGLSRFWILNPDSMVPPATAHAFATAPEPAGGFALMGGRLLYHDAPRTIQIDGGTIDRRTGVTGNLGLGGQHPQTAPPDPDRIDFISGASMVASRRFVDAAGPVPEEYFLYYEEVDWALRRGPLPLVYCAGAVVYHRAGTAIGSPTLNRQASAFSLYFKHRARLRFMRRYFPRNLPVALAYTLAKAGQLTLKGEMRAAAAVLRGSFGLPAPQGVRQALSPEARRRAFGPG